MKFQQFHNLITFSQGYEINEECLTLDRNKQEKEFRMKTYTISDKNTP